MEVSTILWKMRVYLYNWVYFFDFFHIEDIVPLVTFNIKFNIVPSFQNLKNAGTVYIFMIFFHKVIFSL